MFLAPPRPTANDKHHPREVVFVLDRSGSMGFTNVFPHAQKALVTALQQLKPQDRFSICCFDDRQIWFGGCCPEPSNELVESTLAELGLPGPDETITIINPETGRPYPTKDGNLRTGTRTPADAKTTTQQISNDVKAHNPELTKTKQQEQGAGAPTPVEEPKREKPVCVRAKPEFVQRAIEWVNGIKPAGLTDILTPLKQAVYGLYNSSRAIETSRSTLKTIMVITDGAVENEREICQFASRVSSAVRIFGFGIGVDCNAYFLRKLSSLGRGYSDVCIVRDTLESQMIGLLSHAQLPVLRDVAVSLVDKDGELLFPKKKPVDNKADSDPAENTSEETDLVTATYWCPDTCPDLYVHAPIIVSCSYRGQLPADAQFHVSGSLPGDVSWSKLVPLERTDAIPLRKVFAQQNIEMLVADSWLANLESDAGKDIRARCVSMAVAEGMPCPYTQMVSVEMTKEEQEQLQTMYPDPTTRRLFFNVNVRKHKKVLIIGTTLTAAVAFGSLAASLTGGVAVAGAEAGAGAGAGCCENGCECDCDCDPGDCCCPM